MILNDVLMYFDYSIREGQKFAWECFGPNTWAIDLYTNDDMRNHVWVVYDTKTTQVYYMHFQCDSSGRNVYAWVDPDHEVAYKRDEYFPRDKYQCYSLTSFLEMAVDVFNGREPDFNKMYNIDINVEPEVEAALHLMAQEKGITFDELIQNIIREHVEADLKKTTT